MATTTIAELRDGSHERLDWSHKQPEAEIILQLQVDFPTNICYLQDHGCKVNWASFIWDYQSVITLLKNFHNYSLFSLSAARISIYS